MLLTPVLLPAAADRVHRQQIIPHPAFDATWAMKSYEERLRFLPIECGCRKATNRQELKLDPRHLASVSAVLWKPIGIGA
jgi:hypothetical protein